MKIYLSGPISGIDNYKENFNQATKKLCAKGYKVFNPASIVLEHEPEDEHEKWIAYMKVCVAELPKADKVVVLKGWRDSKGANIEVRLAVDLEIDVISFREFTE